MSKRAPSGKKGAPRMSEADLAAFKEKNGAQRVHDPMDGRAALLALDVPLARLQGGPGRVLQRPVSDPALAALLPVPTEPVDGAVSARDALAALLPAKPGRGGTPRGGVSPAAPGAKKKRRGVELGPIMDSLKHPVREALVGHGDDGPTLSVWFAGSRLLTVNEIFSILPFRKYDTWAYKKRWKELIQEALLTRDPAVPLPLFDGPTRLVLFRRGTNKLDLDSFQTVFKYAIDGLRKAGVLVEDNPEIVVETVSEQRIGEPAVGLRLERLESWTAPPEIDVHQAWFGREEPAAPPLPLRVRGRKTLATAGTSPSSSAPATPKRRSRKVPMATDDAITTTRPVTVDGSNAIGTGTDPAAPPATSRRRRASGGAG